MFGENDLYRSFEFRFQRAVRRVGNDILHGIFPYLRGVDGVKRNVVHFDHVRADQDVRRKRSVVIVELHVFQKIFLGERRILHHLVSFRTLHDIRQLIHISIGNNFTALRDADHVAVTVHTVHISHLASVDIPHVADIFIAPAALPSTE